MVAGSSSAQLQASSATATGSSANIEEGVYFVRGQFVRVTAQRIVLDKYTDTPSYRIGLGITETLITPEADTSLLDNATGSSNVNAKGAHRLKITLTLSKLPIGSAEDTNFIELIRVRNGRIQEVTRNTEYSVLGETLARRTFDESGDYSVRPFGVDVRESLDDGLNEGVYVSGANTDQGATTSESLMAVQISPAKHMFVVMRLKQLHQHLLMSKNQEPLKNLKVLLLLLKLVTLQRLLKFTIHQTYHHSLVVRLQNHIELSL